MNLELVLCLTASLGWIVTAFLLYQSTKRNNEFESWLNTEREAHERTRQTLRDAVGRLRRENRDRFLGIIEEQRGS